MGGGGTGGGEWGSNQVGVSGIRQSEAPFLESEGLPGERGFRRGQQELRGEHPEWAMFNTHPRGAARHLIWINEKGRATLDTRAWGPLAYRWLLKPWDHRGKRRGRGPGAQLGGDRNWLARWKPGKAQSQQRASTHHTRLSIPRACNMLSGCARPTHAVPFEDIPMDGRERSRERERGTLISCLPDVPQPGTKPTTLRGNRTTDNLRVPG